MAAFPLDPTMRREALLHNLRTFYVTVAIAIVFVDGRFVRNGNLGSSGTMTHQDNTQAWLCARSQPKHEHIASANLRRFLNVEVFCPRFRARKLTRRGVVWATESLFPNYLFVRCHIETMLENVRYTPGVSHIVNFGRRYPVVPDFIIADLRQMFGEQDLTVCDQLPSAGDEVIVADKAFWGMQAKVLRVLPAKQRVRVLMDVLGRTTAVDLQLTAVVPTGRTWPAKLSNA